MALGRGLNALISSTIKSSDAKSDDSGVVKVWHIPLTKIVTNSNQPRKRFSTEELSELAASIREHGVLQPVILTERTDGGYDLIAGERRTRAAKLAGLPTVPAIIKQLPEQSKLEVALVENIQRSNLDPIEEAFAYKRLMDEFGLTQQQVADKVGKGRPTVANIVRLLDLPAPAQAALIEGKINSGHARALLSLEKESDQLSALSSMLGQKITVREMEKVAATKKIASGGIVRRDPNILYLENQLRSALGTRVSISKKGGAGTISISFHSDEELKRLVKQLEG